MDVKTIVESFSLGQVAVLVAILSTAVVWLLSLVFRQSLARWLSALIIPLALAYSIYWLPVWLGSDPSEYSVWEFLGVTTWFLAGALPSAVLVWVLQKRTGKRSPTI